jgi:hypothetical protein
MSGYERYHNILGWLHCHQTTQEPKILIFPPSGAARSSKVKAASSLREPPALIADGIQLENSGRMLRWGASFGELSANTAAILRLRSDMIVLDWTAERFLVGLTGDLYSGRDFGAPDPRAYQDYLPEFHWVSIEVDVMWDATPQGQERGFRDLYAHLERALGPAAFSHPMYEEQLPFIHWEFRGLNVCCCVLGDAPHIRIDHEPNGYPGLKADARAMRAREGKDARVNYVAWPSDLRPEAPTKRR